MKDHGHSNILSPPPFIQPPPRHAGPPSPAEHQLQELLPSPPRPAGARPPEITTQDHLQQKRDTDDLQFLSSPPRPARGTKKKKGARRSFTASPATRPERRKEGKHHAQGTDTIASVNDGAMRALTPNLQAHERAGAPLHLAVPERRPEAEGSGGSAGANKELGVAFLSAS